MLSLSPGVDEPWFWSRLKKAPLPQQAAKPSASKIQRILSTHRIRRIGGLKAREIRQAPALRLAPAVPKRPANMCSCSYPNFVLLRPKETVDQPY